MCLGTSVVGISNIEHHKKKKDRRLEKRTTNDTSTPAQKEFFRQQVVNTNSQEATKLKGLKVFLR